MAQLEALKQQGVHIPTKAEIAPEKAVEPQKKKIVYVDKRKLAKKQQQQQQQNGSHEPSPVSEDAGSEAVTKESTPAEVETTPAPVVEVAPPEEPKDAWDAESEEEEEEEEKKEDPKTLPKKDLKSKEDE